MTARDPHTDTDTDQGLAERLEMAAPSLAPEYRAGLRLRLSDAVAGRLAMVETARRRATAYIAAGVILICVALLGVAGIGPFST